MKVELTPVAGSLKKLGGATALQSDGCHINVVRASRLPADEGNTMQLLIDADIVRYFCVVKSDHSLLPQASDFIMASCIEKDEPVASEK